MASANCVVRLLEGKSFCIFVIFLAGSYVSGKTLLLPFGAEEGDSYLHPNDDESSGSIQISFNFPFFDHNHGSLFVNTNGVLSFLVEVSQFTPSPFPLDGDRRLVAVFWGDVDIRHGGNVSYRELHRAASSEGLFVRADSIIRQAFIGHSRFLASWMFIATWNEVPFYGAFGEALQIRNTFQALLVTNGKHAFAIYNYEEIRWTTGTASGGNSSNGLGGTQAQVGFNAGDGFNFFVVPESRTDAIVDIDKDSNVGTRGRFVFRIDNSDIVDSGCNTDGTGSLTIFPVYSSMLGGDIIRMSGPCLNETSSIMCRFAGVNVTGQVVSNTTAICVSPPVFQIGRVSLKMSTNNGESFDFSGVFTYLSPEDVSPLVTRQEANDWYKQESLTVTWDTESLQDYVDFVRVSVYSYDENLTTGEVKLYLVNCSSQMVPYSNGEFSFSRPNPPEGVQYEVGAIRVSQYSQHEDTDLELALPGLWSDVHNLHWLYPVSNHSAWCQDWLNDEGSDVNFLQVTEPCPCTQTQAQFNFNMFSNDPSCNSVEGCESFRPGAVECVRAERPSSGGGQECCYGEDGNILNVAQTTGGGFAQRRHHRGVTPFQTAGHVPLLSHWMSDLLPREHCCLFSNQTMCDAYVSVRPSQTCENYRAPVMAISTGDPHLTTLDGKKYTFNGVGEYTMLEACNGSFVFQARMTVLQSGGAATVITALAAIESGRSDQIHVEVSERRGIDVWYRNMRSDSTWLMLHIDETQIRQVDLQGVIVIFKKANDTVKAVQVNFECGASFIVSTTAGLLNVMTALREELKGRTRGLYGNWNGEENDDFERPDGTVLSTDATVQEIHYEFGQQWQIKPENSLFRYPAGKSPSDYSNEAFVPFFWSMSDPIDNRVLNLCGNDTQCAFDFIVTGNENIAMATKEVVENFGIAVESAAIGKFQTR
ncbi:protein mesh-like isoform X2 [Acanthaster planci]|uniref:Protein mesh-like isoform X2 n=1 Tax=Acanthaster planci TaxID=133434 RepID=A0A8B7ZIX3_ACAPL|nr:protein mesh-like isoform X2 [Acanthaster planci]